MDEVRRWVVRLKDGRSEVVEAAQWETSPDGPLVFSRTDRGPEGARWKVTVAFYAPDVWERVSENPRP